MTEPQDPFAPPPAGQPVTPPAPPQQPYGAPAYGAPAYGEPLPYGAPTPVARNGFGTWSLVLGVVSFCGLFTFIVPPVLAVVFGLIGRGRAQRREATNGGVALAGIVTGGIALLLGVIVWVFVAANWTAIQRFTDCEDAARGNQTAEQACSDQLSHDLFGTTPQRS